MRKIAFLMLLLVGGAVAFAQPAGVSRVLKTMDFEERRLGNAEDLPMHWTKVQGQDLPHYVNGALTTDRARSGKYAFRFDLNGGGLIYRYDAGQIKVQKGAHYNVECWVQTTPLPNARARMTAYFTDIDMRPLPETVHHSELYATPAGEQDWKKLTVELSAEKADAAFLVIELALLQPEHFEPKTLGKHTLYEQDVHGSAWFDDVSVSQVPKVTMFTDRAGNIFRKGDIPKLSVLVNDRFTDDLAAQLVIRDASGKEVYQRTGALDMSTAEVLGPGVKKMPLILPDLPPGWYEAALVMSSQGQFVGEQTADLVLLADAAAPPPDARFGIIATNLPFDAWSELPQILPYLGAGRVKLAVWSEEGDIMQINSTGFDRLLENLKEISITPTACLLALPPPLAKKLGGSSLNNVLKGDASVWQTPLAYMVSRHADHLDQWQVGGDGSEAFVQKPMREAYQKIYGQFAALIQKPDLAMPWPAWYELDGEMPATVALSVPPSVLPNQLPLYMQDLRGREGHMLSLTLQLLDREQYGRNLQIRDLAQRVIYALAAHAERIDLPLPFTVKRENDMLVKQPQELLMIERTLTMTLGGAEYKGKVPVADGVEAFLFDRAGQGILAIWDRGNSASVKQLSLNLGSRPYQLDLWGNVTPLVSSNNDKENMKVKLNVGAMPTFLIDIDGQIAQLRASVCFDRPLIESSFQSHTRKLRFKNPYKQAISGMVKLKAPPGWTLNPPTFTFSLNPGETFDKELTIEFPYNSFAGPKTVNADFLVQADRNSTFTVPIILNLGLSDVGVQTIALRDGKDVIVQQMITNYGEKAIDYTAFAMFPGQARQERLVTNLEPGRTTIKRYRFTDVTITPDAKVRTGVKELTGTRILNDETPIQ